MPRIKPIYNFVGNNCEQFTDTDSVAARMERRAHSHAIKSARGSRPHRTGKEPVGRHTGVSNGIGKRAYKWARRVPTLSIKQADILLAQRLQELA